MQRVFFSCMTEKEKKKKIKVWHLRLASLWQLALYLCGGGSRASFVLADRATVPSTQGHDTGHSYVGKLGVVWRGVT